MACRRVPPELAEWQPVDQLVGRVAAFLPWTCAPKDPGAPWLPTADVFARVAGVATATEARVVETTEHVGVYYLTVSARGGTATGGEAAATARRVVAGQLTPLPPGVDEWEERRGPMRAP